MTNGNTLLLDDEELSLDQTKTSQSGLFRACCILGLATIFYFYENLLNVAPSAMKPELMSAFVKDASEFGSLSAYFLYAYGLMQIPAGLLMDRYGPRCLLTLACALCTMGTLFFSQATSLCSAKMGRLLIGAGAGFALVSCLKLAIGWFPPKRFAFLTGASVTVGYLGSSVGLASISKAVQWLGWQSALQSAFLFGIVLTVLIWFVVRDKAPHVKAHYLETPSKKYGFMEGLWLVMQNRQTWIASLYAAFMYVPTLALALWAIPYLGETQGYSRELSGPMASLIFVGWAVGAPIYGLISDHLGKRNLPMYFAALATLITCLGIIYLKNIPPFAMGTGIFLLGIFSSNFILAFAVVREINKPEISGTAIGFINTLNTLFGALTQPMIGKILDLTSSSTLTHNGEKIFDVEAYQMAFASLPICIMVAILMLFYLKETNCKPAPH